MITEVTKDNFDKEVLNVSKKLIMVDFWGPQCHQCIALMPKVEELAKKYSKKMKVVKMNILSSNDPSFRLFCVSLKVMSLPTFIFYKNGEEVKRLTGKVTAKDLEDAIEEFLKKKSRRKKQ